MPAIAYHITWTTYGSWLPGDERGWVQSGVPEIQAPDATLAEATRQRLAEAAVVLSPAQREIVETTIREHCTPRLDVARRQPEE